jgi:tetratricopeptide (TPR) repeat protein
MKKATSASRFKAGLTCGLFALCTVASTLVFPKDKDKGSDTAVIALAGFASGCTVELDATPVARTSKKGTLELDQVSPGDHYVHVVCPGGAQQAFFVSPKVGATTSIRPEAPQPPPTPLEAAQIHDGLRRLVQAAVDARNAGNADEAIADLRRATLLDPENADLHRELGITFLLLRDWERARVEYLEAIKHDPGEAESYNGLGYALDKLGDPKAALREFRFAMRLDPDDTTYEQHYLEALAELDAKQAEEKKKR